MDRFPSPYFCPVWSYPSDLSDLVSVLCICLFLSYLSPFLFLLSPSFFLSLLIFHLSFSPHISLKLLPPSASHLWISLLPFLSLPLYRLPPLLRSNSRLINDVQETGCFYNTDTTLLPFFLSLQIPPFSLFHFVNTPHPPNLSCLLPLLAKKKKKG